MQNIRHHEWAMVKVRFDRYLVKEHVASHLFQVCCAETDALALLVNVCDEAAHALVLLKYILQMFGHLSAASYEMLSAPAAV